MNRAPLNPILDPDHHQPDQCDVITRLHPLAGNWSAEPIVRLRHFLRSALRAYGLRAISCTTADAEPAQRDAAQPQGEPVKP